MGCGSNKSRSHPKMSYPGCTRSRRRNSHTAPGKENVEGGARRNWGPEGAQNILLSLAELPFMKMKLRMMVRRPSLAVWLSLRRGEQRHPPEGGTWGALSPFPPLQKTPRGCQRPHRQPLTASGSPPRPVAGCWSGCRCGVWCRSPPAAAQTPAGGKDLIQRVQGGGNPNPKPHSYTRTPRYLLQDPACLVDNLGVDVFVFPDDFFQDVCREKGRR